MSFTKEQQEQFKEAARPLVLFMQQHCHPHCTTIVTSIHAELVEGMLGQPFSFPDKG